jgi:RND family efflux transporter MFP subunit
MANKSSLGLKLLISGVLLAAIAMAVVFYLRPVAIVSTVTHGKIFNVVAGSVVVEAEQMIELKSEVAGRVLQSELKPGKIMQTGDLLVQIDTADLDLEIERQESEYRATKARFAVGSLNELELETAKDKLAFSERQFERGNLAKTELDARRRDVKAIEQRAELEKISNQLTLESLENQLKVKQRQKDKMALKAPFDGVVASIAVHQGALVQGGERIATVISTSRLVDAKISEENFANVQPGQRAVVRFLTYGDSQFEATVLRKLPTAEAGSQRYIAYLDVKIPLDRLLPDLTGEVSIIVGEHEAKALVPRRAVFDGFVFVVKDGVVQRRKLKLDYTSLTSAEVVEGLAEGDQVIIDEVDNFRDGLHVRTELVK